MLKRLVLAILLVCSLSAILAEPPATLGGALDGMIAAAHKRPQWKQAQIGVIVQSLKDGTTWYTHNADKAFIPASTTKVITASMALEYLTPDFRFPTSVLTDGKLMDGILHGDLILQGGGDPMLTPEDLQAFAKTLASGDPATGLTPVKQIAGQLILDDSCFPCQGPLVEPTWDPSDLPWYYAAPSSGLSCAHNTVTITVRGTSVGEPATVDVTPETKLFSIDNQTTTSGDVKTGAVVVTPQGYRVCVKGQLAPNAEYSEMISIPDPARFIDEQFRQALAAQGITFVEDAPPVIGDPKPQTVLITHHSPLLSDALSHMLKESDNHTAEQFRWVMLSRLQQQVPLANRYSAIQKDFAEHIGLADMQGMSLVDGSGLSRKNQLTPQAIVQVLAYMATSPNFTTFYQALPVAGVDGTLKNRMIGTSAMADVHAKTGTMRGISTLAGYVTTTSGEQLVFAIFVNGYSSGAVEARQLQDSIAAYLAGL